MAEGFPLLSGAKLQPDASDERDTKLRILLAGAVTAFGLINSIKPAVSIRELESAGILPARSVCLHTLITEGLVQDKRGLP